MSLTAEDLPRRALQRLYENCFGHYDYSARGDRALDPVNVIHSIQKTLHRKEAVDAFQTVCSGIKDEAELACFAALVAGLANPEHRDNRKIGKSSAVIFEAACVKLEDALALMTPQKAFATLCEYQDHFTGAFGVAAVAANKLRDIYKHLPTPQDNLLAINVRNNIMVISKRNCA